MKRPKDGGVPSAAKPDGAKGNESGPMGILSRLRNLNMPDPKYQQEQLWADTATAAVNTDPTKYVVVRNDEDSLYLGLRVYTNKNVPATVVGRLKAEPEKKEKDSSSGDGTGESKDPKEDKKQSLSSLVDSLEDVCDCDECKGRTSHPD